MSVSANDLRAFATAAQAEQSDSPTSTARLARRFVDQHRDAVIHAARAGKYSVTVDVPEALRRCMPLIEQFFREDFAGVSTTSLVRSVVVSWA